MILGLVSAKLAEDKTGTWEGRMLELWLQQGWMRQIRFAAGIGLLTYLVSFFFLGPSGQKTVYYTAVGLPGLLLIPDLFSLLRSEKKWAVLSFLFFACYFALSSLWSENGTLLSGLKLLLSLFVLLLVINSTAMQRTDFSIWVSKAVLVGGTCAIFYFGAAFVNKVISTGQFFNLLAIRHSLRSLGGIGDGNPINSAIYLGVAVLAACWSFPNYRLLGKIGLFTVIVAGTGLMFLTQSRGPFFALILTLFLMAIIRRHRDDFVMWGGVVFFGLAAVSYLNLVPVILDRISAPNYRLEIWTHAIEQIKENLVFGHGLGDSADIPISGEQQTSNSTVSHSHSSIIETFRVGGIVGGAAFLLMVIANAYIRSKSNDERRFFMYWLFFGVLCLSTNGRLPFIRPSVEWFAFWIPLFFASFSLEWCNAVSPSKLRDVDVREAA